MNADIPINKPQPILNPKELTLFDRNTNIRSAIQALESGTPILVTEFYSNGMLLLKELQRHLKKKFPNKSFKEQRTYRSEFQKLSNLVLIEIENTI